MQIIYFPPQVPAPLTACNNAEGSVPAGIQQDAELLRIMAANSGWSEIGGRAIREWSDFQTGGDVIGRTQWVGKPQWAKGFGTVKQIGATVEKAIAGKRKLCKQQKLLIDAMLYEIEDMRAAA